MPHRDGCHRNAVLLALEDDLGLEEFCVGLTLTHGDPVIKGNCARLKLRGHNRPYRPGSEDVFAGPLQRTSYLPKYIEWVRASVLGDSRHPFYSCLSSELAVG